jgi:hypothetical protein
VVLAETAPPALVGIVFLGDHTRRGLAVVAILAFILAVACAVVLARFGEAGDGDDAGTRDELIERKDGQQSTSTVC